MPVLLLTTDLMTSSKVDAAAKLRGSQLLVAANGIALVERATETPGALVLLDLSSLKGETEELVAKLRELPTPPRAIVAFAPHVHEARLEAAERAGCDGVMARGRFHSQVDEILAEYDGAE